MRRNQMAQNVDHQPGARILPPSLRCVSRQERAFVECGVPGFNYAVIVIQHGHQKSCELCGHLPKSVERGVKFVAKWEMLQPLLSAGFPWPFEGKQRHPFAGHIAEQDGGFLAIELRGFVGKVRVTREHIVHRAHHAVKLLPRGYHRPRRRGDGAAAREHAV